MNQTPLPRRLRCGRCAGTGELRTDERCENCEGRGFHHVEVVETEQSTSKTVRNRLSDLLPWG